ncbi:MAG: nitrate- and nitrite sensing domain-containing protein [Pseudonocardiaceae bacterium]
MTTHSSGRAPSFAMLGIGAATLRHRGARWRLRDWRLRTKLTAVLLVPLLLAGVLGALRVTDLTRTAQNFAALARQVRFAQQLDLVVYALQGERYQAAAMQASGRTADRGALQTQLQRVNSAVTALRAADLSAAAFPAEVGGRRVPVQRVALSLLSGLPALRQAILRDPAPAAAPANAPMNAPINAPINVSAGAAAGNAVAAYSTLIAVLLELDRRALDGVPDSLGRRADAVKALAIAEEQASWQQAAMLTGILSGGLSVEQQLALRTTDARFAAAGDEFGQAVSAVQRQRYFAARAVVDRERLLSAALDRAVRGAPLETVPGDWNSAAAATVEIIHQEYGALLSELRAVTLARSDRAWHEAFWDGAAIVALLGLAIALLVVVVRSLLQPLRALRTAAFEVADRRLPEAAEQLRSTDGCPSQLDPVPVPVHSREEVGQIARAFDTVHVQAVRLATEQAQLRSSLNDVFVNLSGRSQRLAARQLQLIGELRSEAQDPSLMRNLVALDRLGARMRRHSENLLVLAGGTVCRGPDGPVPVLDVLTDVISEIDDHQRVTVSPPPAAMVAGPIVNDLVHVIAELLDNATSVSPQGTMVTLAATLTEDTSLLVEITDSGPGLPVEQLQWINARLASAPTADVSVSGQMGLFVVRELAAQHGISVRLRQRLGGGGTTATVQLPPSMVTLDLRVPMDRAADSNSGSAGWTGTEEQLPLQVSVIDESIEGELFSPSSISPASLGAVTSQCSQPRTAQQEWLELFGSNGQTSHETAATDQCASPAQLASPRPPDRMAVTQPDEVHEEIFEMVSAWFRERQSTPVSAPPTTRATEWWTPFDEGWQSAQALRGRIDHEFTQAGLPKREPRAHLVSGADGGVLPPPVLTGPARTPDAVRGRLSRYQRGLNVGRHARIGPDEQFTWTDTLQRPFDERASEENQQ